MTQQVDSQSKPLAARIPWPVFLVLGIALLVVGIALHSRPTEIGGPVILGVLLLLGAVVSFGKRQQ